MNAIEELTPKPESKELTFTNVAIYRSGAMFGVNRTDCKEVKVTLGVKYAQYNDAVRVEYLEKGKRTKRAFVLSYSPWLRICALKDAVTPASAMDSNGDGSSTSRYTSCDPRYETDFEDSTLETPWLVSIGAGAREGAHLERCLKAHPKREDDPTLRWPGYRTATDPETHAQHARRVGVEGCSAAHANYNGGCLNCGYQGGAK